MEDLNWQVQIGPDVQGSCSGVVNGTSATFFVSPGGDPGVTYASYSTTAGSEWVPLANNEVVAVSGFNDVQWQLSPPAGEQVKFLIGVSA